MAGRARGILSEKHGEDVVLLDVTELSGVTDYYLIATGSSPPHLKAMYAAVLQELKQDGVACYRKTGEPEGGWMAIDYVDVIIHIFLEDTRRYYGIEHLWARAPLVA